MDVYIRYAIAVSQKELFFAKIASHPLHAAAGHGSKAGVDQRYLPGFGPVLVDWHAFLREIEGDVTDVKKIVGEIAFNDVAQIAATDHKLIHSAGRKDLHDVPEDRHAADFDHRLWPKVALLPYAR